MSSKKLLFSSIVVLVLLSFLLVTSVKASSEMWNQLYGGSEYDFAYSIIETSDGGFAIAGCTGSFGAGGGDFWLIKTDEYGDVEWNRTYGGTGVDCAYSLIETSDGGFALAGVTDSFGAGGNDFWLIKTDFFGNIEWNQTYGGSDSNIAYVLVETSDGGYALAGSSGSPLYFPIGVGTTDFWLVKTDAYGNMEWNKTYGGPEDEVAYSLVETADRGLALGGYTESGGESGHFWLVKTDVSGTVDWNQTYGGSKSNYAFSLVATSDGGFALASTNFWLIKTDAYGTVEWNYTYGIKYDHIVYSMVETFDGGFALAGGENGFWLVKTDAYGNMEWNQTYQRSECDRPYSLIQTSDGGYALVGDTINLASSDVWVIKANETGIIPEFPSGIILPLLLVVTVFVIVFKKKLFHQKS
ncbi:MAG: hypothetical protein NWF06_04320 [Candidatus Bathyarchaeota archaeon]|nr:hypothetical protein [Candidatus Bathyarchaeum sp.]